MHFYTNPPIIVTTKMMRNATLLKPRPLRQRPPAVIRRWQQQRTRWLSTLAPGSLFHRLFDHIPGVHFFAKDRQGHLMFTSQGLRQRYSMQDESDILGMTDFDLNPGSMAQAYVNDDDQLLQGKAASIERIELWWDRQGMPDWFLVTKLPIHDKNGEIQGVMGLLRRPDESERRLPVFQTVAQAVELIRRDYSKPLLIEQVATACGQSLRQLQRHFQAAFGITPQEFLLKTRVLAAARLLESTAASVSEIATACGFPDQSAFTQHFRKRTGQTPSCYRQQQRLMPHSTMNGASHLLAQRVSQP
ncbi:AraC family transcriptional regulator [Prosthecobacter sp. SYSU 5D2]|uniref:AraC family transcriptional regulator n=1 Tax=Prosthecobacter sp. SYSU 5D2 TaxID=3134134 RepID=UPI0031FE461C